MGIVREETTQQSRIKETIVKSLNLKNIADGARSIHHIRKQNKRAVAQLARALDSKSSGWGFESLLP